MTQAQHDFIERIIVRNPNALVRWHEKRWGVIVDIQQEVPHAERWRTGAIVAVYPNGQWERDKPIPLRPEDWPRGARTPKELAEYDAAP